MYSTYCTPYSLRRMKRAVFAGIIQSGNGSDRPILVKLIEGPKTIKR